MKRHHAVAHREAGHTSADSRNCARHLMPKDARRGVRTGVNFLEVGAANPARIDTYEHLAHTDHRNADSLGLNIVDSAINRCLHRGRNSFVHISY